VKILKTLKHELLLVIPPTVFFFITFCLLIMTRRLTLREYDIPLTGFANAVVGALIVGKVVLVVDNFRFMNRYPDKPLIYNVLWKTGVYLIATLLVRYLEHLVPLLSKFGNFAEAHRHLVEEIVWPHFWLIQMWLIVLFFVYCSLRELIRAIGKREFTAMFLGLESRANS
jgi:hypothetical protein